MLTFKKGPDHTQVTYNCLVELNWKPKIDKIFVKPNVGASSLFANTHPDVVRGIIKYLKDLGITDIIVGEGSVQTEHIGTPYNFEYCGWNELAKDEDIELVDLNNPGTERELIDWKFGKISIPKLLMDRSYINVAKLKTHMQTTVSLCMKNQKGLLLIPQRKQFHSLGIHEPVYELAKVVQPELCIVDGITGVEGNGPGDWGKPVKSEVVTAGDDMVEVDRFSSRIMGIDPDSVEHLRLTNFVDNIHPTKDIIHEFKLPDKEFRMFNVHMWPGNACSTCISGVGKMSKLARKTLSGILYFVKKGIFGRLDIMIGNLEELPTDHGFCIFYGDCVKKFASKYPEYPFIPGCPPTDKDVTEVLFS